MSNLTVANQASLSLNMFEIMDKAYKFAEIMAVSDIIPMHYRGKPSNVFIAIQTAYRMNIDPMLVMQNTYVVSGKLGMNSSFAISLANNSGLFDAGIRYRIEGKGKELAVTAYANLKKNGEEISYRITMAEAIAEGWTKNSKYQTLPELMLRYRAATLLIRTHAPEVINAMHTVEELEDVKMSTKDVTPRYNTMEEDEVLLDTTSNINYSAMLKDLCKNNGVSVKEFANMYDISVSDPLSLKRGVENFNEYLETMISQKNSATENLINEIQAVA